MAKYGNGNRALSGAIFALLLAAAPASSQDVKVGEGEYMAWCARCHGTAGKGDGPLARELETALPDLAQLAKRQGGKFPADRVRETIDGRDAFLAHRSEEMPIWGNWFEHDITAGGLLKQSETKTRDEVEQRIDRIVGYLATIQE